jgi:hypothetical protein
MNQRWWNNEIVCIMLRIIHRYFSKKTNSVEMFSAYILEIDFKIFYFILLTFLFSTQCFCRKFQNRGLWSCALAWYCQKHHLTTHTSYFLNTPLTNNFSLHTTPLHTWLILKNFLFIKGNWYQIVGRLTTGCWAVRLQVWHPWLVLKTSLVLIWYRWMPLLFHCHCPKPVQISGLGTGTWLLYAHSSQTAYWGTIIQSSLLLHSCNKW